MMDSNFWHDKRVFITGHTGFKGSWLCLLLNLLGAKVSGYSLSPPTTPNLFDLCRIEKLVETTISDVRNGEAFIKAMRAAKPDIVVHMAAQPLVRDSYKIPVDTYSINVMGTVNMLEAVRKCSSVRAVVNVTTDKCYENKEWHWGYRENEPLGGYDPYSNSKACSELVTSAYRNSYFNPNEYAAHSVGVASARAGNVIGGGDWASDRLIPDCVRAILKGQKITIRNPKAIRPWQHVLEPLSGYLMLAEKLYETGPLYAEAWNFGPDDEDAKTVEWLIRRFCSCWGGTAAFELDANQQPHEAHYLKLDYSKARAELGWKPLWNLEKAIDSVIDWTRSYAGDCDMFRTTITQIEEYERQLAGRLSDGRES